MTEKEKIECLSDLCRFLAIHQEEVHNSIWKAVSYENKGSYEKVVNQLIMRTPMIQGTMNQINLAKIGKQKTNMKNIGKAVNYLLEQQDEVKPLPKYKAYTEPKLEWLKEKKKLLYCGEEVSISSICLNNTVRITTKDLGELGKKFTMEELFKNHTELDGTPFGEIIN